MASMFDAMKGTTPGVQQQQKAANTMQLMQLAKQAPVTATTAQISQAGAGMASQVAKQNLQNVERAVKQGQQIGEMEAKQQQANLQKDLQQKEIISRQQLQNDYNKLAELDRDLSDRVMADRSKMLVDSAGLKYLNQKQLLDYKVATARSQQDLLDYQQQVETLYKKKIMMMEVAFQKITQLSENRYLQDKMNLTETQRKLLAKAKAEAEVRLANEKKRQAEINGQRQLLMSVGSSLIGAAFVVGGPVGWAMGAAGATALGGGLSQ
jgi:hypothetical protein